MKIENTEQLVREVNEALGDFCRQFAEQRKQLARLGRSPAKDRLFEYDSTTGRDWAINAGGGTEVQYHIFFRDNCCGYGLGFNAAYVPFKNEKTPREYMEPFVRAYGSLKNSELVHSLKDKGFRFLFGNEDELPLLKDDYYLFGKTLALSTDNELQTNDFEQLITDIKGPLFSLYCKIFELKKQGDVEMEKNSSVVCSLQTNQNLILTGAPGTGKTFLAWQMASAMTGDPNPMEIGNEKLAHPHIGFCQFHPSMDYTDFVEGLRPVKLKTGNESIGFELRDGIFKKFCRNAADAHIKQTDEKFVFIIDEINRGDISKIFGELFFAIDPGYRGEKGRIQTPYANLLAENDEKDVFKDGFYVPENVFIIGTMNDIDRGVESMDFAIRRRFAWREIKPEETQESIFASKDNLENNEGARNRMDNLNAAIREDSDLGPAFQIGGAYFKKLDGDNYEALWKNHLEPLLREYLRGHERKVIKDKIEIFKVEFDNPNKKPPSDE